MCGVDQCHCFLVLVMRQACLHCFCVDTYAEESDAVSLFVLLFLDSESQVASDLTEVSFVPVWCVGECCGVWKDGEKVVKVVEWMFQSPLGLEDPFQGRCEEVKDGWRCAAAKWEKLVAPPCVHPAAS